MFPAFLNVFLSLEESRIATEGLFVLTIIIPLQRKGSSTNKEWVFLSDFETKALH
jgi:hypothetical protein